MKLDKFQKIVITYALIVSVITSPYILDTFNNTDKYTKNSYGKFISKISSQIKYNRFSSTYALNSIDYLKARRYFKFKKQVVVAVIDTGIDHNHSFLKDNLVGTNNRKVSSDNYGVDLSTKKISYKPKDSHGHGTHVAGIIKSVFPEVKILPIKYYSAKASGHQNVTNSNRAFRYAIDQNVDIINYSAGGYYFNDEEYKLIEEARAKGIIVIAAAGNDSTNLDLKDKHYPSNYDSDNIISVCNHNEDFKLSKGSNWGKNIDLCAPGYKIKSSSIGNGVAKTSGTSQATAFVSGVVAMIKSQYPNLTYKEIKKIVIDSTVKEESLKNVVSSGRLNAYNAIELASRINVQKIIDTYPRAIASKE